jgi:hypothetical protein
VVPPLSYFIVKITIHSNTMFSKVKSLLPNTVAQVYTDGLGCDLIFPLKSKAFVCHGGDYHIRLLGCWQSNAMLCCHYIHAHGFMSNVSSILL